jgi:intergrase/recombinase
MAVRVRRILAEYDFWVHHPEELKEKLRKLTASYGRKTVEKWASLIDANQ